MNAEQIEDILRPYLNGGCAVPPRLFEQLALYLELLTRWNARTNLTSIREPAQMVRRHFGESLFAAQHLGRCETALDFGSGAGFPGLPAQLLWPQLRVTLAESQNKKATFLREAVRSLSLDTEVWAGRVEAMPAGRRFDVVALRAVDDMDNAMERAALRASVRLVVLSTEPYSLKVPAGYTVSGTVPIPETERGQVVILERTPQYTRPPEDGQSDSQA